MTVLTALLSLLCCSTFICCFYLVPERCDLDYVNTNYITEYNFNVRRFGRNGAYGVNMEATLLQTWGNNVTFHVYLYEFLHNQYKKTFVEFHFKFCELLFSDPIIGMAVVRSGAFTKCPAPPGHYVLKNLSIGIDDFPYVWPFEKARAVGVIMHGKTTMARGSLYILFKQNSKKKTE